MPYFKNKDINLLFIHIPKTGGTTVEQYLSKKYSIELNIKNLYCKLGFNINNYIKLILEKKLNNNIQKLKNFNINSTAQHFTYNNIYKFKDIFNINFYDNSLKIITIVRNPYNRLISDLFWYKKININSTPEEVYYIIKDYINETKLDNHNIPQYLFLIDENNKINDNITIFKTESLNDDMINYGFIDFCNEKRRNINKNNSDYYNYLNNDSIELINNFYENDFLYFDYDKL